VNNTVEYIYSLNSDYHQYGMLTLLQCTSMYPIPFNAANLSVMRTFSQKFNLPVGYSDHTEGSIALELAAMLGASVLEFHFTDTRAGKDFRDHKVSLTLDEVNSLAYRLGAFIDLLGSPEKLPTNIEIENNHLSSFRRSLYPSTDLKKGHVIQASDLVELRPVSGISSTYLPHIIGKVLQEDVSALSALRLSMFK
jgi:N-acetylneuraminate synthase/N,N'-diacetyllegionaminate synthase